MIKRLNISILLLLVLLCSDNAAAQKVTMKSVKITLKNGKMIEGRDGFFRHTSFILKVASEKDRRIGYYYNAASEIYPVDKIRSIRYSNRDMKFEGALLFFAATVAIPILIKRPWYMLIFPFTTPMGHALGSGIFINWKNFDLAPYRERISLTGPRPDYSGYLISLKFSLRQ